MRVITLASLGTLAQARALGRSLQRHQPDWSHEVVLVAADAVAAPIVAAEQSLRLRSVSAALDLDIEALLALHGEQDMSILLLPRLLGRYAERSEEPLLHLPSSVWVLAPLEPVAAALASQAVLLVPRTEVELPEDGLRPSREELDHAGRIEETIIGVSPGGGAEEFLSWWGGHVEQGLGSLDARRSGERPEDRPWLARYLELAPARFSTAMLDDPGCNLNLWNLHARTLEGDVGNARVDGRWPLRFVNLPGFDPDRPHRLGANASRARVSRSAVLHDLCERYAAELRHSGWADPDHHAMVGRRLDHELVYDESLRALYSSALALGEPVEDLFSEKGTRAFVSWLEGPAPRGAAHGINRYVYHRVARERPDVVRAYPDLDGGDGAGFLAWCLAFAAHELGIPERFMPASSGRLPSLTLERAATANGRVDASTAAQGLAGSASPVAVHQPAERDDLAVRLTGYLGHTLGLGAAARGYVQALGAADVAVRTVTVPLHHLELPVALTDEYGRHDFEDLIYEGRHGFEIVAVNADELPELVERLGEGYFEGPRIGIWGWETNSIPARWQKAFALVDEIWVYSRFMAENIGAATNVPVVALPPPVQPPAEPTAPWRLGVPEGFLFLFVFDYLSTVQRKNPVGLIEAFRRAFAPDEGAQLLIKTINGPLRPLAEEEVLWAAHGRPDIHVIDRSLDSGELAALMTACDCYVSLHRAEGFGLTLAEAMAIGKPVIGTRYSGNVDFMNDENSYLVDYVLGRVGPECEIYPPEGEWAEPSVEHAAQLMRRVYERPTEAAQVGARAREDITRTLSASATGAAMRRRLEQLAARAPASASRG